MANEFDWVAALTADNIDNQEATINLPYEGQLYRIPRGSYTSDEDAVDAFLRGENEPISIEPTDIEGTFLQLQPEEEENDFFANLPAPGRFDRASVVPTTEPESPPFSFRELGLDFYRGLFNTTGTAVQGAALVDLMRRRNAAGDVGQILAGEFADPVEESAAIGGFLALRGGNELERLRQESLLNMPGVEELLKEGSMYQAGQAINDWAAEMFTQNKDYDDTVQRLLGEGAGSLAAFMASSIGTPIFTALMGADVNAASQFADAINSGEGFDTALEASAIGAGVGTTEALPISAVLRRLNKGTGGIFGKKLNALIKDKLGKLGEITGSGVGGAIEESIQEAFVEIANNVSARDIVGYDEERGTFEGAGTSAGVGGTLGAIISLVASSIGVGKRTAMDAARKRLSQDLLRKQETRAEEEADTIISDVPPIADVGSVVERDARFEEIKQQIREEQAENRARLLAENPDQDLGPELSKREIERLANLRIDRAQENQLELDLPDPIEQPRLDLPRDASPIQREFIPTAPRTSRASVSELDIIVTPGTLVEGPSAEVVELDIPPLEAAELNEADMASAQRQQEDRRQAAEIDAFERAGTDFGPEADRRHGEPTQEDVIAEELPNPVNPMPQQRLPLRGPIARVPTRQKELPLEGGGEGSGPPPRPTRPVGSVTDRRSSLVELAKSRSILGEPVEMKVDVEGGATSLNGRTFNHSNRDKKFRLVPKSMRRWVDVATAFGIGRGDVDVQITKEILRNFGQVGKAIAKRAETNMKRVQNIYKGIAKIDIEKAPQEELKLYTEYMHGNVDADTLLEQTPATEEFIDSLDNAKRSIEEMSVEMLNSDMIPAELRPSFEKNLGAYLSVSYAGNTLLRDSAVVDVLNSIPEEIRNRWINSLKQAYINPITDENINLDDYTKGQLIRMAKRNGIIVRKADRNSDGNPVDVAALRGDETNTPVEHTTKQQLINALTTFGGLPQTELDNVMVAALKSISGPTGGGGLSRDRSIERRRDLARSREELEDAGYNEQEIQHVQNTRALLLEVVDPITNIGITMNKMLSTVVAHRVVNSVADLGAAGLVSVGKPDIENGFTELLIPRGHPLSDTRIKDPNNPGEFIHATPQGDIADTNEGIYVTPALAKTFQRLMRPAEKSSMGIDWIRRLAGISKTNLTAFSPRSHPRNTGTAVQLLLLRGHMVTDPRELMAMFYNTLGVAARDIGNKKRSNKQGKAKLQEDLDAVLEYMTARGLFNDSVRTGPVRELLTRVLETRNIELLADNTYMDASFQPIEGVLRQLKQKSKGRQKLTRLTAKLAEKPMAAFRLEDEAVKVLAFMVERRRFARLSGRDDLVAIIDGTVQPTSGQLAELREFDKGIAAHITNVYPTYSRVPEPLRVASRSLWVTPFPSFAAEMWRNGINDILDIKDLAKGEGRWSGVPRNKRMELLTTRIITSTAYYASINSLISSVGMWSLASVGLAPTDEELDEALKETKRLMSEGGVYDQHKLDMAIRPLSPTYVEDALFQIVDFNPGVDITLRALDFTVPNQQQMAGLHGIFDVVELLVEGDYARAMVRLYKTAEIVGGDYVKADVLAATAWEIANNQTGTGAPVYGDLDDPEVVALKSLMHLSKIAFPGSRVWRESEKFYDAYQEGRVSKEGLEFIMGVSDTTFRLDALFSSRWKNRSKSSYSINKVNTKINRLIRDKEPMTDEKFIKKYLEYEKERYDSFLEFKLLVRSGEALGMTPKQMQDLIDKDNFMNEPGGMDIKDIIQGRYKPYKPDKDNVMSSFYAKDYHKLSIAEKEAAERAMKPIVANRLRLIRNYRTKVRYQDYTL